MQGNKNVFRMRVAIKFQEANFCENCKYPILARKTQ